MSRFVAAPALAPLKDFQRATAAHVFERLYGDDDPVRRFLIADEVGLGKTLVARGVIAQTIEHLQDVVERIDVVYVCSNAQIARQNLQRLRVFDQGHFELAERITMLPATAHQLAANKINLVSFTPGTSFELTGGSGQARERALLRLVLREAWGAQQFRRRGSLRVFQGGVTTLDRFERVYQDAARSFGNTLDPDLVANFAAVLRAHDSQADDAGRPTLQARFEELTHIFGKDRPVTGWSRPQRQARHAFVGELRNLLARACLDALRPDLIILDEFQRFKHLLDEPRGPKASPATMLAHELFEHVDQDSGSQARVLLLSATPYKMLTNQADVEDNHHDDLVATVRFLLRDDEPAVDQLRRDLRALRRGLFQVGRDGGDAAREALKRVESTLRRVMVRTERLASTPDRSGMLEARTCDGIELLPQEVSRYLANARLARDLGAPDPLEYWKSAPYVLNFADGYRLRANFDEVVDAQPGRLGRATVAAGVLNFDRIRAFEPISLEHPRLRWLIGDTLDRGAWQLLWVPPSLPYIQPSGPFADPDLTGFTKRLVFSSWKIVPAAISTLVTYEAERRMVSATGAARFRNSPEARQNLSRLLDFNYSNERLTGMPVLGLLYPSVVLAQLGDPLELVRSRGGEPIPADEAVEMVAARIQQRLDELFGDIAETGGHVSSEGRDERWYWVAPIWLDRLAEPSSTREVFGNLGELRSAFTGAGQEDGASRFVDHLTRAREMATMTSYPELDAPPPDLAEVLARMALAAPGVVAVRALARATGRGVGERATRLAACRVAWGFRTLFNIPEVTDLIRHLYPEEPYWRRTLDYSIAGGLQAVLDEYAHVLLGARGHLDPSSDAALDDIAGVMNDTVRLRTVRYGVTRIDVDRDTVTRSADRLRANFALRLSDERSDDGTNTRPSDVREAFNSPFRPFVLATTSAGQEGLDFHPYCHAVVHWNLPANPVDLEQREGRVHRFQGHAIRRNIAAINAGAGLSATGDPWTAMFDAAERDREPGTTDIVPSWVYVNEDGTAVHRYVPALPLSRDRSHADRLQQAVASYRLAFGQPRQEDLLAYLADEIDEEALAQLADELRIDLSPSRRSGESHVVV